MKELFRYMARMIRLMSLVGLMGLVGCSDDTEQESRRRITFETQPCTTEFVQKEDISNARSAATMGGTRTWTPPDGYYLYDDPNAVSPTNNEVYRLFAEQKNMFYKSIDVFFTRDGKEPLNGMFFYKPSDSRWHLNMEIEETGDYYVYGYIPEEVADGASISGNSSYSDGAVLTIKGIKTVTHSDVSVIVGAKDGPNESTATSSTSHESLTTGNFKVSAQQVQIGSETGNSNYIYLLFDHLYSALAFNFKIDADYNELRTIKLRKLDLIGYGDANGTHIKAKYNVEIKLKSNTTGASPIEKVTFSPDPTSGNLAFEPIFEDDGDGVELKPDEPTPFMGCFVPGQNTHFKLRTTYDVYDKNPQKDNSGNIIYENGKPVYNLIRRGCEAENLINLSEKFSTSGTLRGQMFKITIKVVPTYLYVLSEPDLDNPTITVN